MEQTPSPSLELATFTEGIETEVETKLSNAEEDAILRDTSGNFADWVALFLRRVILLFENLPEEGAHGTASGATEGML